MTQGQNHMNVPAHLLEQVKVPAPGPPLATVPVLGRTTTAAPTLAGAAEF